MMNIPTRGYGGRKARVATWGYGGFLSNAVELIVNKFQRKHKGRIKLFVENPLLRRNKYELLIKQSLEVLGQIGSTLENSILQVRTANYFLWNSCYIKRFQQFRMRNKLSHNKLMRILDEL